MNIAKKQQTQQDYIDNLLSLTGMGLKSGLKQIKKYLAKQGNLHNRLAVFHIAGTNGKGSVCHMLAQTLHKQFGKKVGLFTSPHLLHISERIQVNGQAIPSTKLNQLIGDIHEATKDDYRFSYFETLTLVAVQHFLEENVDYAVIEVGLGGTLDSTNIWDKPLATCITSIGLDHKRLLGPSLAQIQRNKMGIMKLGIPCYTPLDNKLMHEGARRKKADLRLVNTLKPTSLLGPHQKINAGCAYQILTDLGFDKKGVSAGLMSVAHPGRLQYIRNNILLDGAHNRAGLQALGTYIDEIRPQWKKIITIFGTSKKVYEVADFTDVLIRGDEHIIVKPSVFRGLDPETYTQLINLDNVSIEKNPTQALEQVMKGLEDDTLVLIYGSLYLLGEVISLLDLDSVL